MEVTEPKICRLCLKVICKNDYEIVEKKLVMVKTIFVDLNWTITENPIMCYECFDELQNSYEFKLMCLTTEEQIKAASENKQDEVDLWQMRRENDQESRKEKKICRFCLKLHENNVCFNLEEKEDLSLMLQKCLPELDLFMVQEPVICQNCFDALEGVFNFVMSCTGVEKSINNYCNIKGSNSNNKVDLYNVLEFTKIKKESDCEDMHAEEFLSENRAFIKSENIEDKELEIKSEACVKNEPLEFEEERETSVKQEEVEIKAESEASKRQEAQSEELQNSFSCPHCPFTTKYKYNIKWHIMVVHDKPKEHAFICDVCSYLTFYRSRLLEHSRLHTQDLPFVCDVCNEKYNHRRSLDNHIVTKHPDSKQVVVTKVHKCNVCDFQTVYVTLLTRHVQSVHDKKDLKTFKCDQCAYSTKKRFDLKRHALIHTDTKPLACPECSKSFTTKTNLDSHILYRHSDKKNAMELISSKIHYCKSCDFKAVNPTNMNGHVKSHHKK